MIIFRRNTASQEFALGPFVDATDGNTAETGLTIANTDIKFQWNGATTQTNKNSGGATHVAGGNYYATADAIDTATCNTGKVTVQVSGALAWQDSVQVWPEPVYDSFFPSAAGNPLPIFGILDWGTAQTSAPGTLVHRAALGLANDIPNGSIEFVYSGTGAGQARSIYDFVGASDTSSVSPDWTTTPSTDSEYVTIAAPPAATNSAALPAVNTTHFGGTAGTFSSGRPEVNTTHWAGTAVASATVNANVTQLSGDSVAADNAEAFFDGTGYAGTNNVIPTVTTATNVTTVNGLAANVITAAATAADFGTEVAAAVLAAAAADPIDANVEQLNTVPLVGDGSVTPFTV